ncbi:MAG: ribonuclease R [Spirochaetota bacterium]
MSQKRKNVTGRLAITSKGFGFVHVEDGADIFVAYENLHTAVDGDIVEAEVFPSTRKTKPAGRIVRVRERSDRNIVGVFRRTDKGGKVYPEDDRLPSSLLIPAKKIKEEGLDKELRSGQVVVARLVEWNDPNKKPLGAIVRIVGDQDEPGMDVKTVALTKGLPLEFPREVTEAAERIPAPDMKAELAERVDLRDQTCFTIDPPDAKDFDDALSIRQRKDGLFEVGVHIADVSHFVEEGSVIDEEAQKRGTSVYFVQTVLPMLPERLSNELCSLRPNEERLAFSVTAVLDSTGAVHDRRIERTVIRSRKRFTYEEAEKVLHGGAHDYAREVSLLHLLSQVLRRRREEAGSIDFDMTAKQISLDKNGIPRMIAPKERLEANRLVEEFMLLANRIVAGFVTELERSWKRKVPFIYRVHERPKPEDVESLGAILESLGLPYRFGDDVEPEDYRKVLGIIQDLEFKDFIEKIALYSMTKAVYSTENYGHFGLGFDSYTHFTSPIRRYPDLIVHRLIKRYIKRRRLGRTGALESFMEKAAVHSSEMERVATAAEREYVKIKSLQFLAQKVGNVYEGVISGVTSFGLFVELTHYLIEGLVALASIKDDHYEYDKENYRYVGKKTGKVYRLGDRVEVRVDKVSVSDRKADFVLV